MLSMSTNQQTIVPVTLNPIPEPEQTPSSQPSCMITIHGAEIALFPGVEEHIIQTIMRELNKR